MPPGTVSLAYSIADQSFDRTKSLGILNLSLQLAEALAARPEVGRLELLSNSSLAEWHGRVTGRPVHLFDRAAFSRLGRMVWDQLQVYGVAAGHDVEWLMLPKGFASFCRTPRLRLATYVHDVIGTWYQRQYPGSVSRGESWYFERSLMATITQSTVVFTNSDFTRRELLAFCERRRVSPPRIVVAGIGFHPVDRAPGARRDAIVVMASPLPHKRTDLAVPFVRDWQRSAGFAGPVHWVGRWPRHIVKPDVEGWEYHERLDEAAYRLLLGRARVLVYVSEYEGFGMPPVEAVLHGACPVYSALPATVEAMRGAGAAFENDSYTSFAQAMNRALELPPEEIASLGRSLLARHNWPAVAARVVAALQSAGASA